MKEVVYVVEMIESESGWGSRLDDTLYFKSKALALRYEKEYNKTYNNSPTVPNWYIVANYEGERLVDMKDKIFTETWDF